MEVVAYEVKKEIPLASGKVITKVYKQHYTRRKKNEIPREELPGVIFDILQGRQRRVSVCAQYGVTKYYLDKEIDRFIETLRALYHNQGGS